MGSVGGTYHHQGVPQVAALHAGKHAAVEGGRKGGSVGGVYHQGRECGRCGEDVWKARTAIRVHRKKQHSQLVHMRKQGKGDVGGAYFIVLLMGPVAHALAAFTLFLAIPPSAFPPSFFPFPLMFPSADVPQPHEAQHQRQRHLSLHLPSPSACAYAVPPLVPPLHTRSMRVSALTSSAGP